MRHISVYLTLSLFFLLFHTGTRAQEVVVPAGTLLHCTLDEPNFFSATGDVSYKEGLMRGFLTLRTLQGELLADGEITQVAEGDRVTDHLFFRFKDGSVYDDATIFSQSGSLRLLSDHLIERGPSFKHPIETSLNTSTGEVTARYTDDDGKEKAVSQRLALPADVANGLLFTLVKHIQPSAPETTVSYVVTTPKARLVNLVIVPQGEEPISHGTIKLKAMRYIIKVKTGGAARLLEGLMGKQPQSSQVWVVVGESPAFVKSEGPFYDGGPIWRVELSAPATF
ncbi:MAG TPA: hypothetical protein VHT28_07530 [Silvibacterium sp.]|nr:hypothetical protein [Silvibacterium sp.]